VSDQDPTVRHTLSLEVSPAEALVLFEFTARRVYDGKRSEEHPAEYAVLSSLLAQLERTLVEPLRADYDELLAAARVEVAGECF